MTGESHFENPMPSSEQKNVESAWSEAKVNVALELLLRPAGLVWMVVSGGVAPSIVH